MTSTVAEIRRPLDLAELKATLTEKTGGAEESGSEASYEVPAKKSVKAVMKKAAARSAPRKTPKKKLAVKLFHSLVGKREKATVLPAFLLYCLYD